MNMEELKRRVCEANLELDARGLVTYTWGNVSGVCRSSGVVAIKPSGVPYSELTPDKIVLVSLEDGSPIGEGLNPSSDTPTHVEMYLRFPELGGVAHTHSVNATAFAQARRAIPCLGTTHADYFYGDIPVTRQMTPAEIAGPYELNTGKLIAETLTNLKGESALNSPAVLVAQHGPFTWGNSPEKALEASVVLEEVARMARFTIAINPDIRAIGRELLDKHFLRKHGANAYYGQKR